MKIDDYIIKMIDLYDKNDYLLYAIFGIVIIGIYAIYKSLTG